MRGSAISARLLAGIALSHSFLRFFIGLFRIHRGPYTLLMIQTIKQITNRVPSSPYPNMASPSSIQPLFSRGSFHCGPFPGTGSVSLRTRRRLLDGFRGIGLLLNFALGMIQIRAVGAISVAAWLQAVSDRSVQRSSFNFVAACKHETKEKRL